MAKADSRKNERQPRPDDRIVLMNGQEAFLRSLATTRLREAIEAKDGQVDAFLYEGASASAAEVLDECRSFGLMAARKLVIVDNAEQLVKEDNRELFERYAQTPNEGTTLVLRSGAWRAGKLDEMIGKVGLVFFCDPLPSDQAVKWAIGRAAKEHKATLEPAAAAMLVDRIGVEMGKLDSEIGKLAAMGASGAGSLITRDLVAGAVDESREESAWSAQAELLSGSAASSLGAVRSAIDVSREPPTLVMYAMVDLARKLHGVSAAAGKGGNPWALKGALKLFGPAGDAVLRIGPGLRRSDARAALRSAIQADARSKSGLTDPERAAEVMALKLSQLVRNAAGR